MTTPTPAQVEALIERLNDPEIHQDTCQIRILGPEHHCDCYAGKQAKKAASAFAALRDENAALRTLLRVAKCPACDGSGGIPHQIGPDEWEQQQCQWCDERNTLLKRKD